jgi:hypothetical protein
MSNKTQQSQEADEYFERHKMTFNGIDYLDKEDFLAYVSHLAAHITDINAGDIPTPSKGQETNY